MKKLFMLGVIGLSTISLAACGSSDNGPEINVYTRATTSGTREGFFSGIGAGDAKGDNNLLVDTFVETTGNGDMITKIKNDVDGIGYISLAGLEESGLTGLNFNGVVPNTANVLDESYELSREFAYVSMDNDGTREGMMVEEWNNFLASTNGRIVLENEGVIVSADPDASEYVPGAVCTDDAGSVTVKFGGSTSVQGAAEEINNAFEGSCDNFAKDENFVGSSASEAVADLDGSMHIGFSTSGPRSAWDVDGASTGTVGIDAIVIVVNKDNDVVSNLTAEQMRKIYVAAGADIDGGSHETNFKYWSELT